MKRTPLWILWLWMATSITAEEGLSLPRNSKATVTRDENQTRVHLPFGTVTLGAPPELRSLSADVGSGVVHAKTVGTFVLSYELVKRKERIVPRRVSVKVSNSETYLTPATDRLREHEAMHRLINDRAAVSMQRDLAAFSTSAEDPVRAEKLFRKAFERWVDRVRERHAEWDDNHVFLSGKSKK